MKEVQKVCTACGQLFWGGNASRFCPACKGERHKRDNTPKSKKNCGWCGNEFMPAKSAIKFCCPECRKAAFDSRRKKAQRSGKGSPRPGLKRDDVPKGCFSCPYDDCIYDCWFNCRYLKNPEQEALARAEQERREIQQALEKIRRAVG